MTQALSEAFNLAAHVLAEARVQPEKNALQILKLSGAERWSYGKLEAAVRGTGRGLLQAGVQPGARLLLRLGNSVDFPIAWLGAIAAGILPVASSAQLTTPEVTALCADLAPSAILAAPGVALPEGAAVPVIDLARLRGFRDLPPCDWATGDAGRPAFLTFTSGTSGRARAVLHAHRSVLARAGLGPDWHDLQSSDRLLHAGALNWSYTLMSGLLDPWLHGATALIPAEGITPAQLPLLLKRFDATIFAATPGVFRQMLKSPAVALPKLRHALSAGEKLPDALRASFTESYHRPICEAFGMSECSTFISESPARAAPAGCVGFAQSGRRIAVLDEAGAPQAEGCPGHLAIHAQDAGLCLGYFRADAETAARRRGEWFLTGDHAVLEAGGAVRLLGRSDDLLNPGGHRVSPLEIEEVMNRHPAITESAAIELEVAPGTRVIALIYSGTPCEERDLAAFAEGSLARYKQPRLYRHTDALPKGANNKLARRALREGLSLAPAGKDTDGHA